MWAIRRDCEYHWLEKIKSIATGERERWCPSSDDALKFSDINTAHECLDLRVEKANSGLRVVCLIDDERVEKLNVLGWLLYCKLIDDELGI